MSTVLLVIHLMIATALVATVLLQRSEGGALGIGGGGGGGLMTGRGAANLLTRATAILAAAFFLTSIALTILARQSAGPSGVLDELNRQQPSSPAQGGGILPKLQPDKPAEPATPQVPQSQ